LTGAASLLGPRPVYVQGQRQARPRPAFKASKRWPGNTIVEQLAEERRQAPRGHAAWRIDTISDIDTLRRNAWRWLELERESADPDAAFQSYAWCSAWAETWCGPNGNVQLQVKLIHRGETLVGLLPLMVQKSEGVRILGILGGPHTQISNALIRSGHDHLDGIRLALAEAEFVADADVLQLGFIAEGSPLANALSREDLHADVASPISLLTWPGITTGESYVESLSKNRRKDFNRKLRMLEEHGAVSFETIDASSYRFGETIRMALDWKQQWLSRNGVLSGGLSAPDIDEFLTSLSPWDGTFTPEVDILRVGHDPVALVINLTGNGCRHAWLSSYYEDYTTMSPGMLAHQMSIAAGIDAGLTSYSFLGHPTPFKETMCNEAVSLLRYEKALTSRGAVWLKAWSNGVRPIVAAAARGFWKLVK